MTIKEARESVGLSQKQCSDYLQMPLNTLQNWEQGARKPPEYVERLVIAEILRYTT